MTAADLALTATLVLLLPGYMLARSLVRRNASVGGRVARYRRTMATVGAPLLGVVALWVAERRPLALLGLGAPGPVGGGLIAIAVLFIAVLAIMAPRARRPTDPARSQAAAAMMPVGRRETAWFLGFALAAGAGWEVLYRGFLWWALAPMVGAVAAVLVMALSYGVAHGYHSRGALIGSLLSALLFAGGYALTGSLWWLIVIHIGLPLVGLRVRPPAA